MVSTKLHERLASLRQRERWLQTAWGFSRVLGFVLLFVLLACALDYTLDRYGETPLLVRRLLFAGLVVVSLLTAIFFVLVPIRRRLDDAELALWVEERNPQLHHRLISAVQLNQPGAKTEGMSPELIAVVTREAESDAQKVAFTDVADHRRLKWSLLLALPLLMIALVPIVLAPALSGALLARLLLANVDIPRRVTLENDTREVWPLGESVVLRIGARGIEESEAGELVLRQPGGEERYPLVAPQIDPATGEGSYIVELPPFSDDLTFRAYVGDGRLANPGVIRFVARPVVVRQEAWVILPPYTDPMPNGRPYEIEQPRGEVAGIKGSSVRVRAKIQKPVTSVFVETLAPEQQQPTDEAEASDSSLPPADKVLRKFAAHTVHPIWHIHENDVPAFAAGSLFAHLGSPVGSGFLAATDLASSRPPTPADGTSIDAVFDLRANEKAYRIVVTDEYGFTNDPPPRRSLRVVPEEPPTVALLREQLPPLASLAGIGSDDDDLEGLPVPTGGPLRIAFTASGPYGLGYARLKYRVVKKRESESEEASEEKWHEFRLPEVKASPQAGVFDPRRGAFEFSTEKDNVWFHKVPSLRPTLAGGRFVFQTRSMLPDGKGGFTGPKEGDQIEYYIEVFADRDPNAGRPSARSETRVKNVVSYTELVNWLRDTINEERRLRQLNVRQEQVFPPRK